MINKLAQEIHKANKLKGFYDDAKNIGEMLCLIHSEVSEALECDRKNKYCISTNRSNIQALKPTSTDLAAKQWKKAFEHEIKDTFEDELADIMIRVMDLAAYKGIDLEKHIEMKMRYNSLRPYKHGKKY